jgi:hypothetical protein
MANEILKRDDNRITVLAGVTDDANTEVRMLRVDPSTGRLKISVLGSGSGTGDVSSNTSTSVDNEVALFSGTGGKIIKRASGSGIAKLTSGVLSVVAAPSGAIVGDTDTQTLTNKTINGSNNNLTVLAGSQLSGETPLANGGTGASLTDPNADRILFWDDSAGQVTWLTAGSGLTISGTTITASANGSATTYNVNQTSHGFAVGDVIKSSGSANSYAKAQADSVANAEVVGIVTAVTDANNFTFASHGIITTGVPTAAAGTVYFLSASSAGALTATEPSAVGQVSKPVLIVLESASKALFLNLRGMLIQSGDAAYMTWSEVTGTSQNAVVNTAYIANNGSLVTITMPSTAAIGDRISVVGKGTGGWRIAQNAGQTIHFGSSNTTTGVGGRLDSTNRYDVVHIVCTTANTDFVVIGSQGNIMVT